MCDSGLDDAFPFLRSLSTLTTTLLFKPPLPPTRPYPVECLYGDVPVPDVVLQPPHLGPHSVVDRLCQVGGRRAAARGTWNTARTRESMSG
jgi:hypothetical protein